MEKEKNITKMEKKNNKIPKTKFEDACLAAKNSYKCCNIF